MEVITSDRYRSFVYCAYAGICVCVGGGGGGGVKIWLLLFGHFRIFGGIATI